jgi:phosphoglycerate dehydrogenase-like enzyme
VDAVDWSMRTTEADAYLEKVSRRLQAADIEASEMEAFGAAKVQQLDTLLRDSDFVFLCARLTAETAEMIGARELALMKPSAYFINTARGRIVDQQALTKALQEKRIAGATLDVFAGESLARGDQILQLDTVTLTPHIAGASRDVLRHCADVAAEEAHRFLHGEPMRNCLNPQVLA